MPELPDVVPGALITAAYNNDMRDRAVMRYANTAARDASVLVPVSGDLAWLQDVDRLTIYNGAGWDTIVPGEPADAGGIFQIAVGGTEDLTSATVVNWPTNLVVSGTVPVGATRIMATCTISQVQTLTDDANHQVGLAFNGTIINPTRVRFAVGENGDITVTIGQRSVSAGAAFELRSQGSRVAGSGALRVITDRLSFIDWRFGN